MNDQPTILVIVGITGDLSRRKLLPAIFNIAKAGQLPKKFTVIGITRRNVSKQEILAETFIGEQTAVEAEKYFKSNLHVYKMNISEAKEYEALKTHLASIEKSWGAAAQRLFYLSVPPQVSYPVIESLGKSGLSAVKNTKLLLEKPFGVDLPSAQGLVAHTKKYFPEQQVYRIDHYLAKGMAQNILVFRGANSLFKRTWSSDFIDRIDVLASEKIGIEGRATFYEQTGALRDIIQSHLLQLAALTIMELPPEGDWEHVPHKRLEALRSIEIPVGEPVSTYAIRGQYEGYADEVSNPGTSTETFVSLRLYSKNPRWKDVPITLTTGKALNKKTSEIRIHYKKESEGEANQLVIRIQPHEGIELQLWAKKPGYERQIETVPLHFRYDEFYESLPEAYEQVLLDAIRSNRALFTSSEEVLASWQILEPVLKTWALNDEDLIRYKKGSDVETLQTK
jgi:glucose-6-phosphate 1-dehydrogenase